MASGSAGNSGGSWTFEQVKIVENAFAVYEEDDPGRWEKIAELVGGGKTAADVKKYYDDLVEDVENIMAGNVELPKYNDDEDWVEKEDEEAAEAKTGDDEPAPK